MLIVSLFSLISFGFGMQIVRRVDNINEILDPTTQYRLMNKISDETSSGGGDDDDDVIPTLFVADNDGGDDATSDHVDRDDESRMWSLEVGTMSKRGVDPMSIPRLIKEPPLKKRKRDNYEVSHKRGVIVYPSAAKQPVPLVRVREPPLKRGQFLLDRILRTNIYDQNRFMDPTQRIRYASNRRILSW